MVYINPVTLGALTQGKLAALYLFALCPMPYVLYLMPYALDHIHTQPKARDEVVQP